MRSPLAIRCTEWLFPDLGYGTVTSTLEKILATLAVAAVVGALSLYNNWNTTDDEVLPDVAALKESNIEQKEQTKLLARTLETIAITQAQQTIRVNERDKAELAQKPKTAWTEADNERYNTAVSQSEQAWEQLKKR